MTDTTLDDDPRGLMNSPSRWPLRPVLPLRRFFDDETVQVGVLMEQRGPTVFLAEGTIEYDSLDEMVEDGWQVD